MMKKRDKQILSRIVQYCDDIDQAIAAFGDSLEALKQNVIFRHAVSMCVLQIGELTHHLTTEFINANTLIPWKDIRKIRNTATHRYESFSMTTLHEAITADIPKLRDYCQKLLAHEMELEDDA